MALIPNTTTTGDQTYRSGTLILLKAAMLLVISFWATTCRRYPFRWQTSSFTNLQHNIKSGELYPSSRQNKSTKHATYAFCSSEMYPFCAAFDTNNNNLAISSRSNGLLSVASSADGTDGGEDADCSRAIWAIRDWMITFNCLYRACVCSSKLSTSLLRAFRCVRASSCPLLRVLVPTASSWDIYFIVTQHFDFTRTITGRTTTLPCWIVASPGRR